MRRWHGSAPISRESGLRSSVGVSLVTMGGLVKHLAYMEDINFTRDLAGRDLPGPWNEVDWSSERGWEWRSAAEETPGQLYPLWDKAVGRSRRASAQAATVGFRAARSVTTNAISASAP